MSRSYYGNKAEELCCRSMEKSGWEVTKRGWPDFLGFDGDTGALVVVEVKKDAKQPLKRQQVRVMRALVEHGVRCYRFTPEEGFVGLFVLDGKLHSQNRMEDRDGKAETLDEA